LKVELPNRDSHLAPPTAIPLDEIHLRMLQVQPEAYGDALTTMVFTAPLRTAWERALGYAEGAEAQLQVRLQLDGVVLAACRSAGDDHAVLSAVGPQLARRGIGAVIAMQGDVPQELTAQLTPRLFSELERDGRIDLALAAARAALPSDQPWWLPTLWMAVKDGALWRTPAAPVHGAGESI
jgi:hypothetical protein